MQHRRNFFVSSLFFPLISSHNKIGCKFEHSLRFHYDFPVFCSRKVLFSNKVLKLKKTVFTDFRICEIFSNPWTLSHALRFLEHLIFQPFLYDCLSFVFKSLLKNIWIRYDCSKGYFFCHKDPFFSRKNKSWIQNFRKRLFPSLEAISLHATDYYIQHSTIFLMSFMRFSFGKSADDDDSSRINVKCFQSNYHFSKYIFYSDYGKVEMEAI